MEREHRDSGKTGERQDDALKVEEQKAREHAKHSPIVLVFVNAYSTIVVFILHLISIESLISVALSVGTTVYVYETSENDFNGSTLNWVLLTFAVVTPMASVIGMAFNRRERALGNIAKIRATGLELYLAHARWDWGFKTGADGVKSSGRSRSIVDWRVHCDQVLDTLLRLFCDLTRYLTLPNSSRARHKVTTCGENEADEILSVSAGLHMQMMDRFSELARLSEIFKQEGLPPNEATRVRQWERFIMEEIEIIRMVKRYRTPQGLRSFGRLFSVFLPAFYAPYYAQLAYDLNSLGVAVAFACLTSIALTSLFETVAQMEDPFLVGSGGLDGIKVAQELLSNFRPRIFRLRTKAFPDAEVFSGEGDTEALRCIEILGPLSAVRILNE